MVATLPIERFYFLHTEEVTGSIPVSPTQLRGHIRLMDMPPFIG